MSAFKSTSFAALLYVGSAALPLGYLLLTGFRGSKRGLMLKLLGLHVLGTALIVAYTFWCQYAGYSEWYWNTALLLPVNGVFLLLYLRALLVQPGSSSR